MTDLSQFSETLAELVASLSRSVVRVEARRRAPASGVVFADGVIVTSNHAVERDEHIRVAAADGRTFDAELKGRDPSTDLAVLGVTARDLTPAPWADASALRLGHLVLAIARPGGPAATLGLASALDDAWRTHAGGRVDRWIENDLDLPTGFSGGVLADAAGRALGVNTSGLVRGRSLTIPSSTVERVVRALLAKGGVERGYLGVGSHPIRLPDKLATETGQQSALIVVSVQPGGPADTAGVMIGDVLLAVEGRATTDVGELVALLDEDRIGKEVVLALVRAGERKELRVTVGSRRWSS